MSEKSKKLAVSSLSDISGVAADSIGNSPEVSSSSLEGGNRVVTSVDQACSIIHTLEWDSQKLIKNAAKITSLKQGRKPYDVKRLEKQGKAYKTNISSGTYSTTLRRVAPRLYMPLLNSSTLTASELPAGTVNGEQKTAHYRETITRAIRSWPRWSTFIRMLAAEVTDYGFVFSAFTDRFEWQPHLCRMDRGFVPTGTEVMDLEPAFFSLRWDYPPSQLLSIVRAAEEAGIKGWDKESVAEAVQDAKAQTAPAQTPVGYRKWEELTREQVWNFSTSKNYRVIEATHLFALELSGKVSHYIVVKEAKAETGKLLYENQDAYRSMSDVVIPVIFNSTDGTIHGSWGAGHLLYDLGTLQEKTFCDMVDNLRNANKQRLQVKDPANINDVKQVVNDTEVIVSGAEFANNLGGVQQNVDAYVTLKNLLQQTMDSKVGAYVPPIPLQNSDIKAAQINAAIQQEKEVSDDAVEHFLSQIAYITGAMERRLTDPESPLLKAQTVLETLREKLTDEEIDILRSQPSIRSVTDFTASASSARAQFATTYLGNNIFKQTELAKLIANGVVGGGTRLADSVVIQDGDQTEATAAARQQILEGGILLLGQDVPVLITDNHAVHMQTMKDNLIKAINAKMIDAARAGLRHYTAHWTAGVSQKVLPVESINTEKSFIADADKALKALEAQKQAQQQQMPPPGAGMAPPPPAPGMGAPPPEQGMPAGPGGAMGPAPVAPSFQ